MRFYQDWSAYIIGKEKDKFSANVPGNVQMDFAAHLGWLDDLQFSNNIRKLEPYKNCEWKYETKLNFETESDEKVFFVAEGIDYEFEIYLDGNKIWHQEGMYTPVEIDITDNAKKGSLLEIVIFKNPEEIAQGIDRKSCKPPVTYGWDWNPPCPISGIWKPAYIECRKSGFINSCEPFYSLDVQNRIAEVRFEYDCAKPVVFSFYDANGKVLYEGSEPNFTLNDINLWWCRGQGEPYLYSWSAKSEDDEKSGQIGFRTVRLVQNAGTSDEPKDNPKSRYQAPITVELNGRRIFAKGSNFVNPELFFGAVTESRYEELILSAKNANMNILRVWGGAGICKDEFYKLCDKYGIMVWQEFMLACNNYIDDEHYLSILEREATSIVKSLRRYTSIIFWCGGNELFNGWSGMNDQSLALRLLNKICYEHDRNRAFLTTAPMEGMAHGGYLFLYEDGQEVFQIFNKARNTCYDEFGVPGITTVENLRKIIPEDQLFPIVKTDAWVAHHAFGAWGKERWMCKPTVDEYFGISDSLEQFCERSAWMQCAGYQAVFEEARRQWPHCSVAANWCYNEPWITAANNSIVAYPNNPKPAYYTVKNSLKDVVPSARISKFVWENNETFNAEIWYHNDSPETVSDKVTVVIEIGDKVFNMLTWDTGEIGANSNKIGPTVNLVLPSIPNAEAIKIYLKSSEDGRDNEYKLLYRYIPPKTVRLLNT